MPLRPSGDSPYPRSVPGEADQRLTLLAPDLAWILRKRKAIVEAHYG
jgi:hypothetical protein